MNIHMRPSDGREAEVLDRRRRCKIAASPHAYVRGSTERFYRWLAELPSGRLPVGPPVWICGDCHLGNIGAIADTAGRVGFQIRDLDQTVVGNPAFDLVRLALSLVTAALASPLPGIVVTRMIEAMVQGYADGLLGEGVDPAEESAIVATTRSRALGRRWRDLSQERMDGKSGRLPRGKKFFDLDAAEWDAFGALAADPAIVSIVLGLEADETSSVTLLDAAYWIKGCSSLGRLRYAGLVRIDRHKGRPKFGLIDVKEAVPYLAPAAPGSWIPTNPAIRVVDGARALSPLLGKRMIASQFGDKPVTVRELLPQDLKIDVEQFSKGEAARAAAHLATIVGRAHGRQMEEAERRSWAATVTEAGPGEAPQWLWAVVIDLMGLHQSGYLEHCRHLADDLP